MLRGLLAGVLCLSSGCSLLLEGSQSQQTGEDAAADAASDANPPCPPPVGLFEAANALGDVDDPSVSPEGLTLYFNWRADGESVFRLMRSTRDHECSAWGTPTELIVDGHPSIRDPRLGPCGDFLYFRSADERAYVLDVNTLASQDTLLEANLSGLFALEAESCTARANRFLVTRNSTFAIEQPGNPTTQLSLSTTPRANPWASPNLEVLVYSSEDEDSGLIYRADEADPLTYPSPILISPPGLRMTDPWVTRTGLVYAAVGEPMDRQLVVLEDRLVID